MNYFHSENGCVHLSNMDCMDNLIINGIDYSKFDLEWAKRGGVVVEKGKPFLYKLIGSEKFGKTMVNYLVRIYFPSPEFISIPEKIVEWQCHRSASSLVLSTSSHPQCGVKH